MKLKYTETETITKDCEIDAEFPFYFSDDFNGETRYSRVDMTDSYFIQVTVYVRDEQYIIIYRRVNEATAAHLAMRKNDGAKPIFDAIRLLLGKD